MKRSKGWLALALLVIAGLKGEVGEGTRADSLHPQELLPVRYGMSVHALRDLEAETAASATSARPRQAEPLRTNPHAQVAAGAVPVDPVLQGQESALPLPISHKNSFEGLGAGNPKFVMQMAPPDANGAAGETQYVQWVNTSLLVFDKNSGRPIAGPILGSMLWSGFGGNCEEHNNGDPIDQFDKLAKRWFLAQFSVNGGTQTGYSECIAVSTSADAGGKYWLYEFEYPVMADYPKVAVWPDGYYASFNMYNEYVDSEGNDGSTFIGARACVYDRAAMLAGRAARQECFQLPSKYFGLLPADLEGNNPPRAGTPDYFVALGTQSNSIDIWKFAVNWNKPSASTFGIGTGIDPNVTIPVAPYTWACNGTGTTCIPQPLKVTNQELLDSVGDRLMFRAGYRHFSDHDALVFNHAVDTGGAGSRTGVRWYEIRNPGQKAPSLYQQGTFAPDGSHRWVGSIAMDKFGDIVLGYSVAGEALFPGVAVTGQKPGDPLNTLRAETTLVSGTGIQVCTPPDGICGCPREDGSCDKLSRWGDYSDLTLDPEDDCTFWYTAEYQAGDGAFIWHTRIISLALDGCTPKQPNATEKRPPGHG
jgi:hypothetical protein